MIFDEMPDDSKPMVLFNTGTFLDLMAGYFVLGKDGKFYLNGGMGSFITGIHGRGNTHKSSLGDSFIDGLMRIYTDAHGVCIDTEYSKDKRRSTSFTKGQLFGDVDIYDRYRLYSDPDYTLNKVWEIVKQIAAAKVANKKDMMFTSPFFDYDGKLIMTWKPTVLFLDSFSQLKSDVEHDALDDKDLEDGKNKTLWLDDGNKKTLLLTQLNKYAARYGIIIVATAHTGDNISLDTYTPPSKELLFQKQKDKIKNVGSKFVTLTHVLAQIQSCKLCHDTAKSPLYKHGDTGNDDLHELEVITSRNKVSPAGISVPFVVSQTHGLLNEVTYLNFLRNNAYVGLDGGSSKPKHACVWLPDVKFTRNDVREQFMSNYELCRAIELVAQYRYIQLSWNLQNLPVDFKRTPEQVFDLLNKNSGRMKDILNTTGHWRYNNAKGDREYLSLFDVIGQL
jgi:hypothetical protein